MKYTMSVADKEKKMCVDDIEFIITHTIEAYARRRRYVKASLPDNVKGTDHLAGLISRGEVLDDGSILTLERVEKIYLSVLERMWLTRGDSVFAKMGYTSGSEDFLVGLRGKLKDQKSSVHFEPIV